MPTLCLELDITDFAFSKPGFKHSVFFSSKNVLWHNPVPSKYTGSVPVYKRKLIYNQTVKDYMLYHNEWI